jgi:hypothetical protein
VGVQVLVSVEVGEGVSVSVGVRVGEGVGVLVELGVGVRDGVAVGVRDGVIVGVGLLQPVVTSTVTKLDTVGLPGSSDLIDAWLGTAAQVLRTPVQV